MKLDPFGEFLFINYYPTASKISALLAFFMVLFMIGMSFYDFKLVDRVSLRLQTGIACYDILFHTGFLWRTPFYNEPSTACTFTGWLFLEISLLYFFLNVSIGANLQLIFIHGRTITKKIEILYWLVPTVSSLLITIPPLALGKTGYSEYNGCYIADSVGSDTTNKLLDFYGVGLLMFLSMLYLIAIVFIVFIKVNRDSELIKDHKFFRDTPTSAKALRSIKFMICRILLYPLTLIISQFAGIISQFYYDFNEQSNELLDHWASLFLPLTGLLNFLAVLCDPTIHSAIRKSYLRLRYKYFTIQSTDLGSNPLRNFDPNSVSIPGSVLDVESQNDYDDISEQEEETISQFIRTL